MKFSVLQEVSPQTIADTMCAAIEGGSGYWSSQFEATAGDVSAPEPSAYGLWYASPTFWASDFRCKIFDHEEEKEYTFGPPHLQRALTIMGEKWGRHFADMLSESGGDSATGDVLLQLTVLGDLVYG